MTLKTIRDTLKPFETELTTLVNKHSLENLSNMPDFIIAEYLINCYLSFSAIVALRDAWHNQEDVTGLPPM